jgi:hypothetical protein
MNAVPFDTLKFARRLEAAGMAAPVAVGTSEALAEAMAGGEFATKADIGEVKQEIGSLRAALKGDIAGLRAEMKSDIGSLRAELKGGIAGVRAEIELLRRDMTIKLGSMIFIAVGVLLAAMRFMPPRM